MYPIDTVNILEKAKELIRVGWCQHWYARNADGETVDLRSDSAVSWCATGAIGRAVNVDIPGGHGIRYNDWLSIVKLVIKVNKTINAGLPSWNDARSRTREDVLEAYDITIRHVHNDRQENTDNT